MAGSRPLIRATWERRTRTTSARLKHWRIYQQTFIDTYTKVALAKLYDRKDALLAADLLNDRVLPFFEEQEVPLLRILTDRGTEYCGQREHHEYQLCLAWRWRTLITAERELNLRRPTASVNGSIAQCRMNAIAWPFAKSYTLLSSSCRMTLMPGSKSTIENALTRASIVLGKHLCRRSWIPGN
jgi:hypothetical protein